MSKPLINPVYRYSFKEELANSLTHGFGVAFGITALIVLIISAARYGTARHIVGFTIFGSSLIILYTASTIYHSLPYNAAKRVFMVIDHCAIYLLIAGTYTPFMIINLRGPWGWSILGIIWAFAAVGIVLKCVCIRKFVKLSICIYIAMGWLCLIALREIITSVSPVSIGFLLIGGFCYTLGVIFFIWEKLPYNHFIWHVFVLCGSIFHFFSVIYILRTG